MSWARSRLKTKCIRAHAPSSAIWKIISYPFAGHCANPIQFRCILQSRAVTKLVFHQVWGHKIPHQRSTLVIKQDWTCTSLTAPLTKNGHLHKLFPIQAILLILVGVPLLARPPVKHAPRYKRRNSGRIDNIALKFLHSFFCLLCVLDLVNLCSKLNFQC